MLLIISGSLLHQILILQDHSQTYGGTSCDLAALRKALNDALWNGRCTETRLVQLKDTAFKVSTPSNGPLLIQRTINKTYQIAPHLRFVNTSTSDLQKLSQYLAAVEDDEMWSDMCELFLRFLRVEYPKARRFQEAFDVRFMERFGSVVVAVNQELGVRGAKVNTSMQHEEWVDIEN